MKPQKPKYLKIDCGWFVRTHLNGNSKRWLIKNESKRAHVNTPTKLDSVFDWKMIIMRLHAIGHFENWIIYRWYKWTEYMFESKITNEKCHSTVWWLVSSMLFAFAEQEKQRRKKGTKWQYCLCVVQFHRDTAWLRVASAVWQQISLKVGKLYLSLNAWIQLCQA